MILDSITNTNFHRQCLFVLFSSFSLACSTVANAESLPEGLAGDWSLELDSGVPAWMSIEEQNGKPVVSLRIYVEPIGPYRDVEVVDGRLKFMITRKQNNNAHSPTQIDVGLRDGKLDGVMVRSAPDSTNEHIKFTGTRIPPMPTKAPDLSKVRFGHPVSLFNGKDMAGWKPHELDKKNGWSVVDGLLTNSTPKTDFSPTGAYANLKTEAVFEDFWLHLEFLVEENRNSGVYLRGMYEAQVVDRDSRMQGVQGVGAIFGTIEPTKNAGRVGGKWQTYDITLVDRHVTVVLNGEKVIDNQPIPRPTAGAIHTNPATAGPIFLQGDHTAVSYRNIYLAPVLVD